MHLHNANVDTNVDAEANVDANANVDATANADASATASVNATLAAEVDAARPPGAAPVAAGTPAWRLVVLVWAMFLVLAWVAALPAWRWFDTSLSLAPEGDRLLGGLNVALLAELAHYDRSSTPAIALGSAWTFVLLALAINPFVAGGIIGALLDRQRTPLEPEGPHLEREHPASTGHRSIERVAAVRHDAVRLTVSRRFMDDGVRFYWRFARLMLVAGAAGAIVAALAAAALAGAQAATDERGWERASLWLDLLILVVPLLLLGLTIVIIDLARIRLARADDGRTLTHLGAALHLLRRNAWRVLRLSATFGLLLALAALAYFALASAFTPRTWPLILLAIAWQQSFSLARTALRIAFLAAEARLVAASSTGRSFS